MYSFPRQVSRAFSLSRTSSNSQAGSAAGSLGEQEPSPLARASGNLSKEPCLSHDGEAMADSVYSSPFSGGRACSSQGSPELDRLRHENTELLVRAMGEIDRVAFSQHLREHLLSEWDMGLKAIF